MRAALRVAVSAALLTAVLAIPSACGFGSYHRYDRGTVELDYRGDGHVAVGTLDLRPCVVDGGSPQRVGTAWGLFGLIPLPVTTASRRPFADDVTQVVARSLMRRGFSCETVRLEADPPIEEAWDRVLDATGGVGLLVVLREWSTDTTIGTTVDYWLEAEVRDQYGTPLASARVNGLEEFSGEVMRSTASAAWRAAIGVYHDALRQLLSDADVVRHLGGVASRPGDSTADGRAARSGGG